MQRKWTNSYHIDNNNTKLFKTGINCGYCSRKLNRSSRPQIFFKMGVLKNFGKFTGKLLCWSLFYNKVVDLSEAVAGQQLY